MLSCCESFRLGYIWVLGLYHSLSNKKVHGCFLKSRYALEFDQILEDISLKSHSALRLSQLVLGQSLCEEWMVEAILCSNPICSIFVQHQPDQIRS